ncbi:CaiB/BaiF CoA transferase family protein [Patulibacter sp. S7RM1-6]
MHGVRVVELAGIGPGPHAAMVLADLGADVVRVERPTPSGPDAEPPRDFVLRNRRSLVADLKDPRDRDVVLRLVERADVLVEGNRPGVAERLGVGPEDCRARNPRLVYGRMTGWGQEGPLAPTAGHDINYLAISGALSMLGRPDERPMPPLNLVADLGGGSMLLVTGVLAALLERERSGVGQVVDAAMVDGVSTLLAMYWSMRAEGTWSSERGTNMTDGGSPFYDTYRCADGRYVAVGAVEPQFYARLLEGLGLDPAALPHQMDREHWPALRERFAAIFAGAGRDEWARRFADLDACVSPVLTLDEVPEHEHVRARGTVRLAHGQHQPAPAPRFSRSVGSEPAPPAPGRCSPEDLLREWRGD